jgi:tetratricopeptide (TPR) repeat protein
MVLEGTVRRAGDWLRITAQLCSADDGRLLWSQRYDHEFSDMLTVQDEIARVIVDALRATSLGEGEAPAPRRRSTASAHAYALYLKGRHAWNRRSSEGIADAVRAFEQAIAIDPEYAPAYAGLADAYAMHADYRSIPVTEGFARAKDYARRALALDPTLAEAHASLAWSLFVYDWEWDAAEASFQRAIALDPRYASAHQWYAFLLVARGRMSDALVESHIAQESDPASVSIRRTLGVCYWYARRWNEAAYHLLRSIEMNPQGEESYRMLGMVRASQECWDEAEQTLREAMEIGQGPLTLATLGWVLGRAGRRDEAEAIRAALAEQARTSYVSPVGFAMLAIGLGDHDSAFAWAERARMERRGWLAYIGVNPVLDPLRDDPRFAALLGRMRL